MLQILNSFLKRITTKDQTFYKNPADLPFGATEVSKLGKKISKALDYDFDKLLSATDLIDDDLTKIINKKPNLVPEFLRTAKNLSSDDWKELINKVKKNESNRNRK